MRLNVHIGFMAEEVTAKFKPRLLGLSHEAESLLVVTREHVAESNSLFEQDLSCYSKLGLAGTMYARKHAATSNPWDSSDPDCSQLAYWLSKALSFDTIHYSFYDVRAKIDNKKPVLSVLKVGSGAITDIFIQAPEMGRQSTLFLKEMNRVLSALIHFIDVKRGLVAPAAKKIDPGFAAAMGKGVIASPVPEIQEIEAVYFEAFGAGGSINPEVEVGSVEAHHITSVMGVRRFKKHDQAHVSKATLRRFGSAGIVHKHSLFFKVPELDEMCLPTTLASSSLFSQEAARLYLLLLAGIPLALSSDYQKYLKATNKAYAHSDEIANMSGVQLREKSLTFVDRTAAYQHVKAIIQAETERLYVFIQANYFSCEKSREIISKELERAGDNSISCAASMFFDSAMKRAANILFGPKGSNANMEDDLMAKVEQYVHGLNRHYEKDHKLKISFACFRVPTDPFTFPDDLISTIKSWATDVNYDLDHYLDAVLWAAFGYDKAFLPVSAHWLIADSCSDHDKPKYFVQTECQTGEMLVLEPFWREIGTDFLITLGTIELPDAVKGAIQALLENIGKSTVDRFADPSFRELLKSYLKTILEFCHLNEEDTDKYKVWVRPNKWNNGAINSLSEMARNGLIEASNIDRALYVSNNIPALLKAGRGRIEALMPESTVESCMSSAGAGASGLM